MLELVVSITIVSLLLAIVIPAVLSVRATARQTECGTKLQQIGGAVLHFESVHLRFPPNGTDRGESFLYLVLPYLDENNLHDSIDTTWDDFDPRMQAARRLPMPKFYCPAESEPQAMGNVTVRTCYVGNDGSGRLRDGTNGVFREDGHARGVYKTGPIRTQNVVDGLSNTAMLSEWLLGSQPPERPRLRTDWETPQRFFDRSESDALAGLCASVPESAATYGWRGGPRGESWLGPGLAQSSYNHILPPNHPSCTNASDVSTGVWTAASQHYGGVNLVHADGHLAFASENIDPRVWRDRGSRIDHDLYP